MFWTGQNERSIFRDDNLWTVLIRSVHWWWDRNDENGAVQLVQRTAIYHVYCQNYGWGWVGNYVCISRQKHTANLLTSVLSTQFIFFHLGNLLLLVRRFVNVFCFRFFLGGGPEMHFFFNRRKKLFYCAHNGEKSERISHCFWNLSIYCEHLTT